MSPGVQDQPGQYRETPLKQKHKKKKKPYVLASQICIELKENAKESCPRM
jgi:hypothetical protein